jgi:predicted DNA-binding transcriptional regulator AlpA
MMNDPNPVYLTARQLQHRFGNVSRMWPYRRMKDAGFPAPVRFGGRLRFWRVDDVERWERERAKTPTAA